MIPVHVGIMTSTPTVMVPSVSVVSKPAVPKKDLSAVQAKASEESGPTTTVFVGNISEKASDMLIRQLLAVRLKEKFFFFVLIKAWNIFRCTVYAILNIVKCVGVTFRFFWK